MSRDDRADPPRMSPSPRDLRASLFSSVGLPAGRGQRGRGGAEPPARDDSFGREEPFERDEPPASEDAIFTPEAIERALAEVAEARPSVQASPRRAAETRGKAKSRPPAKRAASNEPPLGAIVPSQSVAGRALVLVVAIMGFLACLAVGGLALVADAASDWQLDVSREVTVQVKPIDGVAIEARLQKTLDIARATAGVRSARLVDEKESEALLAPWLGSGLDLSALPIPRLVVVELADPAKADLAGLKRRIEAEVRGALVDDHAVWAARLRTMASVMVAAGFAVVVMMLVVMVLSVVFATRAAMAGNSDVIEVLHFVGAEDRFVAREFARHFLVLGLEGGAIGGAAAIFAFLVADFATRSRGDALADQAQALFGGLSVGWTGYAGVVAVVVLVAGLTGLTSRFTVLGHLGRLD